MTAVLYLWWIASNGAITGFSAAWFLFAVQPDRKKHIPALLAITAVLTAAVTRWQIPGAFWLEIPLWMIYAAVIIKIRWTDLLAPLAVLLTWRTFAEAFTAVLTAYAASRFRLPSGGIGAQLAVSLALDALMVLLLLWVKKRVGRSLRKLPSPYLYALLLPSVLIVLGIRYGLRLDSPAFARYLSSWQADGSCTVLFLLFGAAVVFLVLLEILGRAVRLAEQETAMAMLKRQLAAQQTYVEEAKTRSAWYAAFQHDLKNHLLVLSGLIRQAEYGAAERYAASLRAGCGSLEAPVSTGNLVLDTLLKEKLDYARRCGIQTECRVRIPAGFPIEDTDLCVLFFNILDNAIAACMQMEGPQRFLRIKTTARDNFLVIESANTAAVSGPVRKGVGLRNVEAVARKYQGVMETENTGGTFQISVLLCSRRKEAGG